jgi:ABC-type glycerol-3-phosphate transport system substrate-binding protein
MVPTGPIQLAVQGGLMPLDNFLKASKVIKQSDFYPGTWASCTFHGHVYCIPYDYDSFAFFWNKDLFKAAGLDPNKPPRTWAELSTYAKKLTKYDKKGNITQLGFAPWVTSTSAAEWPMWANGGQLWNYKDAKPTMNQPANVAALQGEVNWAKEFGGYPKLLLFASFLRGKYVFYNQGSPVDLYYYTERDNAFDLARRGKKTAAQALKDLQSHVQDQLTKALAHYHG